MWHLEPSLTDADTVYAGVEDAALFRSTDGAVSWHEITGLRGHGTGPQWQPEDISHQPADYPLPEDVVSGKEPFFIVGAIAGG